jgi:hypothetical protein
MRNTANLNGRVCMDTPREVKIFYKRRYYCYCCNDAYIIDVVFGHMGGLDNIAIIFLICFAGGALPSLIF